MELRKTVLVTFADLMTTGYTELCLATSTKYLMAYEAAVTPLTYWVVNFLKRRERLDVYDYDTRFNPVLLND